MNLTQLAAETVELAESVAAEMNLRAKKDLSNVTAADMSGSLQIRGTVDGNLLRVDAESNQITIGTSPVAPHRKLYVNLTSADMTVDGQAIGHAAIESRMDCTGEGTAAINPDGIYGTLWYRPLTATGNYTGSGAAVRGNAYTIDTTYAANVTNLIGVYGRARHESGLGTVTNAIALFADGAQNAGSGTITNTMGIWVEAPDDGVNNYGIYFNNTPNRGHLASNADIRVAPNDTITATFKTAGLALTGYVATTAKTVVGLTAAATAGAGARDFVTDSNATLAAGLGNTVSGGGSNKVPVHSDGTNWRIG